MWGGGACRTSQTWMTGSNSACQAPFGTAPWVCLAVCWAGAVQHYPWCDCVMGVFPVCHSVSTVIPTVPLVTSNSRGVVALGPLSERLIVANTLHSNRVLRLDGDRNRDGCEQRASAHTSAACASTLHSKKKNKRAVLQKCCMGLPSALLSPPSCSP